MSFWPQSCSGLLAPLKHACTLNPETLPETTDLDYEIEYIDIGNVTLEAGILERQKLRFGDAPNRARKPVRRGDILVSTVRTYLKAVAFIEQDASDWIASTGFAVLRSRRDVNARYLYRVVQSNPFVEAVVAASTGVSYPAINPSTLGSIPVPLLDLETQNAIADFLDRETARIDQLIEKKERQVALLGERKGAQASQFVTQGFNPHVTTFSTGIPWLPEAPSHWRVRRIATIFREVDERGNDILPVLSVSINWGISDRELEDEDRHRIVNHIADKTSYKRVRIGDLVYNMMRAWQGAFGVATVDGLVSPAYIVARPNESIHSPYFEPLLRTPMCIEEFRRASKGIADFRQRLYWEHFRQVRVVLPPINEQRAIAQHIQLETAATDRIIVPIQASIDRLREFRSALITAAVTGQVDVATWGKRGTTDRRLDAIESNMAAAVQPERQQARA